MKDIIDLDVNKCREFFEQKVGKSVPFDYIDFRLGIEYATEQMQPYFDAIGAGGVSGKRIAQQCKHRFMWFGDQKKRRCADCCMIEPDAKEQQPVSGADWFRKNDPFRDVIDAALAAQKSRQQNIPEIIPDAMRQGSSQAVGLDERNAFEAWASGFEIYLGKHKKTGQYVSAEASIAYNAWKARSAIENRKDGADVKHSLTADHIPEASEMIREIDNDFIKEHADALNAPSGFTSHEASAWAIGVEHGMRVALDRA